MLIVWMISVVLFLKSAFLFHCILLYISPLHYRKWMWSCETSLHWFLHPPNFLHSDTNYQNRIAIYVLDSLIVYFPQSPRIFYIYQYLLFILGKLLHLIKYCTTAFSHTSFLPFWIFHITYWRHSQLNIVMHVFPSLKRIFPLKILHVVSRLLTDNVTTGLKPQALAKHYFVCQYFQE